jgi:hypothetical protein
LYKYDEKAVTFWYEDHEGKRYFVTMDVREFIKALIQHIPDPVLWCLQPQNQKEIFQIFTEKYSIGR